jgi:hypothetical protein
MSNSTHDYFGVLQENNGYKIMSIILSIITGAMLMPLIVGIIWYERFGSDKKRTLINMLVVSCCWTLIEYGVAVQIPDIVRYSFGPLPSVFCFIQAIVRSSVATDLILFFDAMAVTRFTYIFILKNPANFNDDFWWQMMNIWIKLFSITFQSCWHFTTERQPIGYYICVGKDPLEDTHAPVSGKGIIEIGSILLHISIFSAIQVYKQKFSFGPPTLATHYKGETLVDLESRSLTSFTTNLVSIIGLALSTINVIVLNRMKPDLLNQFPNNILVYYAFLILPTLSTLAAVTVYYISHRPLTKAVRSEVKEYFLIVKDDLVHFIEQLTD